nr:PREDICTED: rho GTPase-activating protein 31 [Latimeria chalumnae]|eukprot:XP_014344892.1 PREDICTED: rho GTPase-activating protein 31 [Latimeria chalumnae]
MKNKGAKQKSKKKGSSAFGCDLAEYLENSGQDVPLVLKSCAEFIETHGIVDGIYRLSGVTSNIQRLRQEFGSDQCPDLTREVYLQDIHCVGSLCKMYFRELPNPLLTYDLYYKFTEAVSAPAEEEQLFRIQNVIKQLPPPHYRTLEYLTKHLTHIASFSSRTNMHNRNLALVWAPNLLSPRRKMSIKSKKWKSIFNLGRSGSECKSKLSRNGSVFVRGQKLCEKATIRAAKSMDSLCSLPTEEEDEKLNQFKRTTATGGFFIPALKTRTVHTGSTYDLSKPENDWDHADISGAAGNSELSKDKNNSKVTQPKAMPEQLKVVRGDDFKCEPTSPKTRRMFYSTSDVPSKSNFPGNLFPLEASPRHQRKALNISEPFAVSVPLRVSAVISINSTPCRVPNKDKLALASVDEASSPEGPDLVEEPSASFPGRIHEAKQTSENTEGQPDSFMEKPEGFVTEKLEPTSKDVSTPEPLASSSAGSMLEREDLSSKSSKEQSPGQERRGSFSSSYVDPSIPGNSPQQQHSAKVGNQQIIMAQPTSKPESTTKPQMVVWENRDCAVQNEQTEEVIIDILMEQLWPDIQHELRIIEPGEDILLEKKHSRRPSLPLALGRVKEGPQITTSLPLSSSVSPRRASLSKHLDSYISTSVSTQNKPSNEGNLEARKILPLPTSVEHLGDTSVPDILSSNTSVLKDTGPDVKSLNEEEHSDTCAVIQFSGPNFCQPGNGPAHEKQAAQMLTHRKDGTSLLLSPEQKINTVDHQADSKSLEPQTLEKLIPGQSSKGKNKNTSGPPNRMHESLDNDEEDSWTDFAPSLELEEPWDDCHEWVTSPLHSPKGKDGQQNNSSLVQCITTETEFSKKPVLDSRQSFESQDNEKEPWVLKQLLPNTKKPSLDGNPQKAKDSFVSDKPQNRPGLGQVELAKSWSLPSGEATKLNTLIDDSMTRHFSLNFDSVSCFTKETPVIAKDSSHVDLVQLFQSSKLASSPESNVYKQDALTARTKSTPLLKSNQLDTAEALGKIITRDSSSSICKDGEGLVLNSNPTGKLENAPSKRNHRPSSLHLDLADMPDSCFSMKSNFASNTPQHLEGDKQHVGQNKTDEYRLHMLNSKWDAFNSDSGSTAFPPPVRRNSAPVSVSAVRTTFMIKTCQAKAVPVIPPKIQFTQIPLPLQVKNIDHQPASHERDKMVTKTESVPSSCRQGTDMAKSETELPQMPRVGNGTKEEKENSKPTSGSLKTPRPIGLHSCSDTPLSKSGQPQDLPVLRRKRSSNGEAVIDNTLSSKIERSSGLQKPSYRSRPGRPQSLILFSPPFPIMDHHSPADTSKVLLSPIKSPNESSPNPVFNEPSDNLKTPEGVTLRNKMTLPKSGQRLETSTSCFYQPQRRSMIFDSRSGRPIE